MKHEDIFFTELLWRPVLAGLETNRLKISCNGWRRALATEDSGWSESLIVSSSKAMLEKWTPYEPSDARTVHPPFAFSRFTKDKLDALRYELLRHPPCSLYHSPVDYHFSKHFKLLIRDESFHNLGHVKDGFGESPVPGRPTFLS
uniref:Reverse transcriptase/retrotransposon-derived protein RNase H-like domain-containing protein n=1 Tax=Trichuris muris TaxID=70415 RepID=A0A5S6R3N7_TRIMR